MALISLPSGLTMATSIADVGDGNGLADGDIYIDTATKKIRMATFTGGLDSDGVTLQAVYSFIKNTWKDTDGYSKFDPPMEPITSEQFEVINGWDFYDDTTRYLIRDGGWALKDASNVLQEEWMNITTLGTFDAASDQAYFIHTADGTPTNFQRTDVVNEAVQIYDNGVFDYRLASNSNFVVYLRIQGKTYASYNLNTDGGKTTLTYRSYALPLVNTGDTKISASDAYITFSGTDTDIDFNTNKTIISTDITNFTDLTAGDRIVISGSSSNNGTFTIDSVESGTQITVVESLTEELAATGVTVQSIHNAMTIKWYPQLTPSASDITFANPSTGTITSAADLDFSDYEIGQVIRIENTTGNTNDGNYTITGVAASVLTVAETFASTGADTSATITIEQAREIDSALAADYRKFEVIIDANQGTTQEVYERFQYDLRQTANMNDGTVSAAKPGKNTDQVLAFIGDTLYTQYSTSDGIGVFIDDYRTVDKNSIVFTDNSDTERTFPYVAAGTIFFNQNLQDAGVNAKYWMYFTSVPYSYTTSPTDVSITVSTKTIASASTTFTDNWIVGESITLSGTSNGNDGTYTINTVNANSVIVDEVIPGTDETGSTVTMTNPNAAFNKRGAILVDRDNGTDITGTISGAASVAFDFDYDNNTQGGRTAATDAPVTLVAIGTTNAQHVKATGTIGRSTANSFTLTASLERNYVS